MKGVLLDTNVIAELMRDRPAPNVVAFLSAQFDAWLSVITLHELEFGLQLLPLGARRAALRDTLTTVMSGYADRILLVEPEAAAWAARLRVKARRSGRVLHLADALLAGTVMAQDLVIATRNTSDFYGLGLGVINPWQTQ